MKKIKLIVFIGLILSLNAVSQDNNIGDIDKYIKSLYSVEGEKIESVYLDNLTDLDFIKVKWIIAYDNNGAYDEKILCRDGNSWQEIIEPSELLQVINSDIVLKNESDVMEFSKMLDLFFDFFGQGETSVKQKDNEWYLIKADWFGTKSGFVITVDDGGIIQSVNKSEDIKL